MNKLLLFAALLGTSAMATPMQPPPAALMQQGEGEGEEDAVCLKCWEDCPIDMHVAHASVGMSLPQIWNKNGGSHLSFQCVTGTCEEKHGPATCVQTSATQLKELQTDLQQRDLPALKETLVASAGKMVVNAKRGAIQIMNCAGGVAVHIPIEAGLVEALTE